MKDFLKKFSKKNHTTGPKKAVLVKTIEQETNEVFKKYKKSFKDLARYDRGEKISAAN
jgi:hypothetical protein